MSNGEKGYSHHISSMDDVPVTRKELEALEGAVVEMDKRIEGLADKHIPVIVKQAVTEALEGRMLSPEELQWTKLAIQRESQSIKLRQALIEKSLTGLIWSGILGLGVLIKEYLQTRGFRL